MRNIKKTDFINLAKYLLVGAFVTFLNVLFSWLFIDIIGMKAIISSTIVGLTIFFIKYYSYVKVNLIKRKFYIFLLIQLTSVLLFILSTAILIDIFSFSTIIVILGVTISLFFLRFCAFYWAKIIKYK